MEELIEIQDPDTGSAPDNPYGIWRAWYMLIVFQIQVLACGVDIAIVTLLVHPIETAFRMNDVGFAAITATPVAIGAAVAAYPAGLLADTVRRSTMVVTGSVIWTVAALIAAHASSEAMFFLARLLAGLGTVIPGPAIFSMVTDAFPHTRRAFAISFYSAAAAVGGGLGLAVCGSLVAATQRNGTFHVAGMLLLPWQQCFVAVAAIGIILLALVLTVPEPPRRDGATRTHKPKLTSTLSIFVRYMRQNWLLWVLLLFGYTMCAASLLNVGTWGPAFGMRHYGAGGAASVALLGIFTAGGALLGSIGGGLFAQRSINHDNPRLLPRMLAVGAILSCAFAGAFPYMPSWLLAVAGIGGASMTLWAMSILVKICIQEATPNEVRGQILSLFGVVGSFASSGGPVLVAFLASGVFAKAGGLGPALAVVGSTASLLAVLLFAFSGCPYERARGEVSYHA